MPQKQDIFLKKARNIAFDKRHRQTIDFNIGKYDAALPKGKAQFFSWEKARHRASQRKNFVVKNLPDLLLEFEKNFEKNGGEVVWAENSEEALSAVARIFAENGVKLVVKSKSMTTEEIGLNEFLEKQGIESVETDLGEFIVQVAGQKPYHIVTPAMHKSKEDIARLFHEKFGTPEGSSPKFLTGFVRERLREIFVKADAGITGANFVIADTGSILLTENEGNAMFSFSFPKIHIAIAGVEKILPSHKDLPLFLPLLATAGTGQKLTAYNSLISAPRQEGEPDGPEKMYVILLDNGRTELYQQPEQGQSLACIRCGACLNACPVYKTIGGYTYATNYTGPIGSVISPFFEGFAGFGHLSFACSLCGKCAAVCPVKIDLPRLLLENRRRYVEQGLPSPTQRLGMKLYARVFSRRRWLDFFPPALKNIFIRSTQQKIWGKMRVLPKAKTSFAKQYEQGKK